MLPQATLLIGILLSSAPQHAIVGAADARVEYVAARQSVDAARRELFATQSRLMGLQAEQRMHAALAAAEPTVVSRRNPEFDRIQAEVRSLDLRVRKLSERLAPAHPERITAEAELDAARRQLAGIPEILSDGPELARAGQSHQAQAKWLAATIEQAETASHRLEEKLATALEEEHRTLSDLLALPLASERHTPGKLETAEAAPVSQWDRGWVVAGIASAALLLILIAGRSRSEMSPKEVPPVPASEPAPFSPRRLVYSAGESASPTALNTKNRRTPVIPRRRVS